jgi:vacuolar-type H+-ATPase subunit E/Vma4
MPYEDLIKAVQESAEERIREIRERARIEAEEILNEARSQEERINQLSLEKTKRALELDNIRQTSALREEAKMRLAKKKDELFHRSFQAAQERLDSLRTDPSYPVIFRRLLTEASAEKQEGEGIIHIDLRDQVTVRQILGELNLNSELVADLHTRGGLTITSPDQAITVLNTIESRMDMAKEQLRAEVFSILFGE